ncbi:hypothetical protein GO009_02450 [Muricauda sp. TY007]|uniref:Uncharacterized protein n=1 Tax=Flagellimonas aurea TaxID=2915619 RepID=A0ABS3GA40_9FLAO|nr:MULTISPECIES: hypothetical protein [Allomuricauda]MBO0356296.1 hypothetical protein [Allomuricauda aurea]NDV14873.1 hypothetical protein [Muricauda sp. TY007]
MKLHSVQAAQTSTFEIDTPSMGLIFEEIPAGAKIKVDLVTSNANDVNRIPEITIEELLDIYCYLGLDHVRNYDMGNDAWTENPLVLFSADGVLPFDDDTKYKVTLSNLGGASFDIFNLDSAKLGTPMVIKKGEVRSTVSERTENYLNVDFLLFSGDTNPEKLTFLVNDLIADGSTQARKVEVSFEQMRAYQRSFEASMYNLGNQTYSNGVYNIGYPIDQLDAVTIHHDTGASEDLNYLTVDYKATQTRLLK